MQREVAVSLNVRHEQRAVIGLGIAGIDAHATREVLRLERHGCDKNGYKR